MKSKLVKMIGLLLAATMITTPVLADWAPTKPIKLVVGYRAGGGADTLSRLVADYLQREHGWKVIVENKAGADGSVAATLVKNSPPDGYTITMLVTGAFATNPLVTKGIAYTAEDFDYLGTTAKAQMVIMARKEAPFDDLPSMAAYAKEKGGLVIASMGKELDLAADLISRHFGIVLKVLPAKGGAGTIKQVLAGEAELGFNAGAHHKYVKSGEFKVIVNLNKEPLVVTPEVKNMHDNGIDYHLAIYFTFAMPKGAPADVRAALVKAIDGAVKDDKVQDLAGKKMEMQVENLGPDGTRDAVYEMVERTRKLLAAQ